MIPRIFCGRYAILFFIRLLSSYYFYSSSWSIGCWKEGSSLGICLRRVYMTLSAMLVYRLNSVFSSPQPSLFLYSSL